MPAQTKADRVETATVAILLIVSVAVLAIGVVGLMI